VNRVRVYALLRVHGDAGANDHLRLVRESESVKGQVPYL
jgi:hypothetical protein